MIHLDEFHCHAAHSHGGAGFHFDQLRLLEQPVFFQLALDQSQCHAGAINRHIDLFQQICQTADMVLVTVGNDDAANLVLVALHIGEIRNDNIHTGHIHIRKCQTAVQNEHVIAALKHGHVLSDLVQTTQRNDTYRCPLLAVLPCRLCIVVVSGAWIVVVTAIAAGGTLAGTLLPRSCPIASLTGLGIVSYFSYLFFFVCQINILTFSRGDSTNVLFSEITVSLPAESALAQTAACSAGTLPPHDAEFSSACSANRLFRKNGLHGKRTPWAIPHKDCATDASSNFSSDETKAE